MNIYAKIGIGLGVAVALFFVGKKVIAQSTTGTDGIGDFQEPDGFNAPDYEAPSGSPLPSDVEINYKKTGAKSSDGREIYLDLKSGKEGVFGTDGAFYAFVTKQRRQQKQFKQTVL